MSIGRRTLGVLNGRQNVELWDEAVWYSYT